MTVRGAISPQEMGICLPHEHVHSRFGQEPAEPPQPPYDYQRAQAEVTPYLQYLHELGCRTVVDCTTAYFGRDPTLLKQLSEASNVHILTNTGYYGAAKDRYVPQSAFTEKPEQIARHWIAEFQHGIGDTGIRPGFIKTAVDEGALSDIDQKLIRAAALTHLQTGLTIAVHTSNNPTAVREQLTILKETGVSPQAWIWTHAQNVPQAEDLLVAAAQGAWISLDGIKTPYFGNNKLQGTHTVNKHLQFLQLLKAKGYLNQLLLSHDGSSFPVGAEAKRPFDTLLTTFIPMLQAAGFSQADIRQLTETNPSRAFTLRVRKA